VCLPLPLSPPASTFMRPPSLLLAAAVAALAAPAACFTSTPPRLRSSPRARATPRGAMRASVSLPRAGAAVGPRVGRGIRGRSGAVVTAMAAAPDAVLPAEPAALQGQLWEAVDVLPGISETRLALRKTQDTGVSDLGFVATAPISKGEVIISVPMRYALVVNLKSSTKGDSEQPSDVRLALQLLRVLDLTDAGETEFDADVKQFWRAYTLRILPRETFAAIAWEEEDIEHLQYERTVEEVKALRSRLEELCKQTLEEEETMDYDEDEDEDEESSSAPPRGRRKVTISRMQAVRLPGGKTMMEDATLRWALSIVRSRSFMLDENVDSPTARRAIVPVADLFNHQPEGPLTWAAMDEELVNPWQVFAAAVDVEPICM
jgi:hypothetical protein